MSEKDPASLPTATTSTAGSDPTNSSTKDSKSVTEEEEGNASENWEAHRDRAKAEGDAAFRQGAFTEAVQAYTKALSLDPDAIRVLSNRSAAYLSLGERSRALQDARACVKLHEASNFSFPKAINRLAAALQSLRRYSDALEEWKKVLKSDPKNAAALRGVDDCAAGLKQLEEEREQQEKNKLAAAQQEKTAESAEVPSAEAKEEEKDDLDDFFNDVDNAVAVQKEEKLAEAQQPQTTVISSQKKSLGTAAEQVSRLTAANYKWRNLNPFFVLDLEHTATTEDISRRYKALSLLLHPDKNRAATSNNPTLTAEKIQEAYDQVLEAKAKLLVDENKANHIRQLVEQGRKQGQEDWGRASRADQSASSLEEYQSRAVQRLFANLEMARRDVEERHRRHEQREREQEEAEETKERDQAKFHKDWQKQERVDKRIGNWRDFQKNKKVKPS